MLLSFTVENWKSFENPATLTMIKTRELQHKESIPVLKSYGVGVLPVAAIYGGNASGKTNLFQAIQYVQDFVVKQRDPLSGTGADPFLLSDTARSRMTRFSIRFLAKDDIVYELAFSLDQEHVHEEKLVRMDGHREITLYHRKSGTKKLVLEPTRSKSDKDHADFILHGTKRNQLFLTNSISQNVEWFRNVYDWFARSLVLISPTAYYGALKNYVGDNRMAMMLRRLDTGVVGLDSQRISAEDANLSPRLRDLLEQEVQKKDSVSVPVGRSRARLFAMKDKQGKLAMDELLTRHRKDDGEGTVDFHMFQESDGTLRLMNLLPAFISVASPAARGVYVVDELDRSLHTLLTKSLLQYYLSCCSPSTRSQLIFTTHDALLMDQRLLRRDETWVTEREKDGGSVLYSFSEFKDARKDKDIRKSYLRGRLGGVPRILLESTFDCSESNDVEQGSAEKR
ncbi:MAG: AAA family ATPase [Candidatus Cryosericum sp.]